MIAAGVTIVLSLLLGWLSAWQWGTRHSPPNQLEISEAKDYNGIISHICVVHWKLLELSKRTKTGKIKTFYDELSISNPEQYDLDALKIVASRTIVARKKELWRRRDSETDQMDDRLLVLTLVSDMLTTELPRQVYDNVFMQGLTGYWGWADRRAFLRDICMWIEDGK